MMNYHRRTVLKTLGSAGVLLTGTIGTASAKGKAGARGDETLFDVAVAADDFDILVTAVEEAGLADVLDGNRQLTVFAPTDAAFEALLGDLEISAEELLEDPDLEDILTYHVTSGRRYAASVIRAPEIEMLNGETVSVDETTLNDGQADIVATDIEASNGVIHVIDGVLLP